MLTKYERELADYWKNWKPGKKPFVANNLDVPEVKVEIKQEVVNLDRLVEDIGDKLWDIL